MKEYTGWRLIREGLRDHRGWKPLWRSSPPKTRYEVIVIGGGGHGLATAYYLARNHGVTSVAVLERGWIGGGNTGRNTTIVRSNYYYPQSVALFELSLKLYETLSSALNFNIMFSQRGLVVIGHSRHDMEQMQRRVGTMRARGVRGVRMLDKSEIAGRVPRLNFDSPHLPIWGGFTQEPAGTVRHDAVAWGYAHAADRLGVDVIQNCEVRGFKFDAQGGINGVETARGDIYGGAIVSCAAGASTLIADMAGFDLPLTSCALQAFVTEPVKPVLDCVFWSLGTGLYVSQSDKGGLVLGGGLDRYASYAQRGSFPVAEAVVGAFAELFPSLARLRVLRQWAGVVDLSPDTSPILGAAPVRGLYLNCGWGLGGFKAIPAGGTLLAHHIATGKPHPIAEPFALQRFATGALIDESAVIGAEH